MRAMVRGNFSNRAHRQSADGEEAGDGENCAGVPAVGAGGNRYNVQRNAAAFGGRRRVGIGTYTTLAPLEGPKRWQLGPTILFDRDRKSAGKGQSVDRGVGGRIQKRRGGG